MKNIEAGESAKKELERRGTEVPGGTFVDCKRISYIPQPDHVQKSLSQLSDPAA
jgi:hypothetical protein